MKIVYPDYYKEFKCIKEKCKHNCCIGWEIDIDCDTYEYYKKIPGEMGDKLRAGIEENGEPHFKLTDGERCPFLNKDGLCEIIINLGEDALCQICSDHPRFINTFEDREEIGIGMCCEAASEILLSKKDKTKLISSGEGEEAEKEFFALREKLFSILQNRKESFENRIKSVCNTINKGEFYKKYSCWQKVYKNLERLDRKWDKYLLCLGETEETEEFDTEFEQIAVYFLYRHLSEAIYDKKYDLRVMFCVLSVMIIRNIFFNTEKTRENLSEILRMYSSEIEYSEENIKNILDILEKNI